MFRPGAAYHGAHPKCKVRPPVDHLRDGELVRKEPANRLQLLRPVAEVIRVRGEVERVVECREEGGVLGAGWRLVERIGEPTGDAIPGPDLRLLADVPSRGRKAARPAPALREQP